MCPRISSIMVIGKTEMEDEYQGDLGPRIEEIEKLIARLDGERAGLISELDRLKRIKDLTPGSAVHFPADVRNGNPKEESVSDRVSRYMSLFQGRNDVYAVRWESARTGKSGYQPACKNEWIHGICKKPFAKCGKCEARELLPLTDDVVKRHLFGSGKEFVIGIYPLCVDESCRFLAVDFDKKTWIEDIRAFRDTCRRYTLPVAVERSRSGNGGHAWIFFSESVPALEARRLGTFLLTETHEARPEIGLDSYDRLFPSQDFLPKGGFGSLIAIPFQRRSVEKGNSLFLDDDMKPYQDQWTFVASITRVDKESVDKIVDRASRLGRILGIRLPVTDDEADEPWRQTPSRRPRITEIQGPIPATAKVTLKDVAYFQKDAISAALRSRLIRLAAFQNPDFYRAQALRLSTFGKPRIISCAEDYPRHFSLPRGCLEEAADFLKEIGVSVAIDDQRNSGTPIFLEFGENLSPEQDAAADSLLKHDIGVLAAATAFGKTIVAAKIIASRGVNTLVLVHRRQLLDQWAIRLREFLGIAPSEVGMIGGGKRNVKGIVDIGLIQSLSRRGEADDLIARYGHLVIDECHHIPAESFERLAKRSPAKYVLGLSATTTRKDGHHPIIFMQCGPIRFRWTARQGALSHPFFHRVIVRRTNFRMTEVVEDIAGERAGAPAGERTGGEAAKMLDIHFLYDKIVNDESRNLLIFEDVMRSITEDGRSPILLTERREHLDMFEAKFKGFVKHVIVFRGGMGSRQREAVMKRLRDVPEELEGLILATGRYLGEGFDDARLDTLFLTMPISWKGTLAQYAGRLHRLHVNKRDVRIYDYVDMNVPVLEKMFKRRLNGYHLIGYEIE